MYRISHPTGCITGKIQLSGSKSETNRLLILQALSGGTFQIDNASDSEDTQVLRQALSTQAELVNCGMAGTAFRFLTAFFSIQEARQTLLTGSERMLQRPIKPLVDALKALGADIQYLGEEGFPPLRITGKKLIGHEVQVDASISSQFITALMLIAPFLPQGLRIRLKGHAVSMPYLYLSSSLMQHLGFRVIMEPQEIFIPQGLPQRKRISVEPDWSSASYPLAMAALAQQAELYLPALRHPSMQGDSSIIGYMEALGLEAVFIGSGYRVGKKSILEKPAYPLQFHLEDSPDLAQTLAVLLAALDIPAHLKGLSTLRIKETDRIHALAIELTQLGCVIEAGSDYIQLKKGIKKTAENIPTIKTYGDHRMAMAFAPLALLFPIQIENPEVVGKSYPRFWEDMKLLGFEIIGV